MKENNYPKVSIIILNWNGLKDTIECLESLKKITYPNYEIIVVDNGSEGNDANVLEERYKNYIKLIRNKENLGFTKGNNIAIRQVIKEGKSDYILLLNNDTTVEPNFLEELIKCTQRHPKVGSIQPKMIWAMHPEVIDSAGLDFSKTGETFNRGQFQPRNYYNKEEEIFGGGSGASLYKVGALKDIEINDEYLDQDFFTMQEDVDLAFRLRWAGWENWYCPKAIIYHYRGKTVGAKSRFTAFYYARNQIWNLFKNLPISFIFKSFPLIIISQIGQLGVNLLKGRFSRAGLILKGRMDGYLKLKKILAKRKKIKKKVDFSEIEKFLILKWRVKIPKEISLVEAKRKGS